MEEHFTLKKEEKKLINTIRERRNQLGFAVLLKTFNYLSYSIHDLNKVPSDVTSYIANQLDIELKHLKAYNKRSSVKDHHIKIIRAYYGIKVFDADAKKKITDWLAKECKVTTNFNDIVKACIYKIRALLPF